MNRNLGIAASALGAFAVIFGAFGVHVLRGHLDEASLQIWHTAVEYQFWHVIALLAIAGTTPAQSRLWNSAGISFVAGIVSFCGSLYALALGAPHWVGAITPLGGVFLILGWVLSAVAFWCNAAKN
jgi:uncharacterized membrane protein YgdD (TMEM256/DUF423 family)